MTTIMTTTDDFDHNIIYHHFFHNLLNIVEFMYDTH
jgi:hypothetical protein